MLTARKIRLLATHRYIRKIKNAMKIKDRLVQRYGLTDNFIFSVWMLRDGRLVNGSYEGHQRDVDHHEIEDFFKPSKLESPGSSYIYMRQHTNGLQYVRTFHRIHKDALTKTIQQAIRTDSFRRPE